VRGHMLAAGRAGVHLTCFFRNPIGMAKAFDGGGASADTSGLKVLLNGQIVALTCIQYQ
jgi:hypothetical protein